MKKKTFIKKIGRWKWISASAIFLLQKFIHANSRTNSYISDYRYGGGGALESSIFTVSTSSIKTLQFSVTCKLYCCYIRTHTDTPNHAPKQKSSMGLWCVCVIACLSCLPIAHIKLKFLIINIRLIINI